MEEWQLIGGAASTPESLDDAVELEVECPHPDLAVDVAHYILSEIQTNCLSSAAQKMIERNTYDAETELAAWLEETQRQNTAIQLLRHATQPNFYQQKAALRAAAYAIWTEQVAQGAPWDHKPIIAQRFPTRGHSTRFHHKYREHEYYYDIWSNIHYGYVGVFCQFSESTLLDGAGLEQIGTDILRIQPPTNRSEANGSGLRRFDDTTDNLSIRLGINLYRRYPNPAQLATQMILDDIEKAPYPIQEGSKLVHSCFQ
jgi:hypothetical protein